MARLGRGYPARPYMRRRLAPRHAHITLATLESVDEFPQLMVRTPNAFVPLPVLESVDEFPALSFFYDTRRTLPVLESVDEFPALTVNVPILPGAQMDGLPGQGEFNGFVLGRTTPYKLKVLTGWRDRPPVDSANVPDPNEHGTLPVRPRVGQRVLLWTGSLRTPRSEIEAAVDALEQALPVLETGTESPFVFNDLGTPYLVFGRINRVNLPDDQQLRLGIGKLVLEWVCSDPRRYSLRRTGINLVVGETTNLPNAGNANTHPVIRLPGPLHRPVLLNTALGRLLSINVTVDEGERLTIDPKRKTAFIGTTNVTGDRTNNSVPIGAFVLGRGPNPITYTSTSGGDIPGVGLYRDAWL